MARVRIAGKKGSKAVKGIVDNTDVKRYIGKKYPTDILINYGLAGARLQQFFRKFPSAKSIPTLNAHIGHGKYSALQKVQKSGIIEVPESRLSLRHSDKTGDWIEKLVNSIGGKGICAARGKGRRNGRYYQRMIKNRKFEIRVHAFTWMPESDWRVQKRLGDHDTIAWNFSQGGHFATVSSPKRWNTYGKALEVTPKILKLFGMSFGAVDFIVGEDYTVYFIEVNSAPGFTEVSQPTYAKAFSALCGMSTSDIRKHV